MLSLRQLSSAVVAATIAMSIVSAPVRAQDSTPSATCDSTFGTDAANVFQSVSTALNGSSPQTSDFAPIAISLAKIRIEYEDVMADAACEAGRQALVKVSSFDEDVMALNILARLDANDKPSYANFVTTIWRPRFDAFKASLAATATPTIGAINAPAVCTDSKFQAQIPGDLKAIPSPDNTPAGIGTALLAILKLRYHYEDTAAPAGCEAVNADMVKVLAAGEDAMLGAVALQADPTNATSCNDFISNAVNTRGGKLYQILLTDLGTPIATPAATASS